MSRLYRKNAAHPYHPPGAHLRHTPTPGRSEGACAQRGRGSPQLLPLGPKRPTTHGRPPKGLLLILHNIIYYYYINNIHYEYYIIIFKKGD